MVGSGFVSGSGVSGLVFRVVSFTFVFNISNISSVGISNRVGHNLGTAIGKSNTVFTSSGISITVLVGSERSTTVVISNSISKLIDSRAIIGGLSMVSRSMVGCSMVDRLVDNRSGVVDGSRLVDRSWVVDRGMVDRGMVDRGMVDRSMVDRGRVVDRGVVDRFGMVDRGMVDSMVSSVHGDMAGGMSMSSILLLIVILMDFIGGSSRLGGYLGVVVSMSTVDGGRDRWGIAVFDRLVRVLVGKSHSQEGEDSDESLKGIKKFFKNCGALKTDIISTKSFKGKEVIAFKI